MIDERSVSGDEELLTVSHLTGVTPRSEKANVNMFMAESMEGYKVCQPGDLVVNTMWAWMGALGMSRHHGIVSPSYHVYRPTRPDQDARYFDFLMRTPEYVTEITRNSRGVWTSRLRLYPEEFLDMECFVPPLAEQRTIADFLDRKTAAIDALIEKKERLLALLAEKRAALIHRAVTKGLDPSVPMKDSGVPWIGEIPGHWEVVKLAFIVSDGPTNGVSPPVTSQPPSVQSFSISVVRGNRVRIRQRDIKEVAGTAGLLTKYSLRKNDILLVRGNGNIALVGKAGLVLEDKPSMVYPDILMRLRGTKGTSVRHLTYVLNSPMVRNQVELAARTTVGTYKVNNQQVKDLRVLKVPEAEAEAIADAIEHGLSKVSALVDRVSRHTDLLREYRQALITAAVTGQLDIASAEDATPALLAADTPAPEYR